MKHVFCKVNVTVAVESGAPLALRVGQHWPSSDPIVLAHSEMFTDDPRYGLTFSVEPPGYRDEVVETATAAPGERRATARAGRS